MLDLVQRTPPTDRPNIAVIESNRMVVSRGEPNLSLEDSDLEALTGLEQAAPLEPASVTWVG